ncbi:hypothetical protein ABVD82_06465, partial [Xanthomonas euvesicatoria]
DAAKELTGTYLQRVPRWWAGKGPRSEAEDLLVRSKDPDHWLCSKPVKLPSDLPTALVGTKAQPA